MLNGARKTDSSCLWQEAGGGAQGTQRMPPNPPSQRAACVTYTWHGAHQEPNTTQHCYAMAAMDIMQWRFTATHVASGTRRCRPAVCCCRLWHHMRGSSGWRSANSQPGEAQNTAAANLPGWAHVCQTTLPNFRGIAHQVCPAPHDCQRHRLHPTHVRTPHAFIMSADLCQLFQRRRTRQHQHPPLRNLQEVRQRQPACQLPRAVPGLCLCLLGQQWCAELRLGWWWCGCQPLHGALTAALFPACSR